MPALKIVPVAFFCFFITWSLTKKSKRDGSLSILVPQFWQSQIILENLTALSNSFLEDREALQAKQRVYALPRRHSKMTQFPLAPK